MRAIVLCIAVFLSAPTNAYSGLEERVYSECMKKYNMIYNVQQCFDNFMDEIDATIPAKHQYCKSTLCRGDNGCYTDKEKNDYALCMSG